MAGAAERVPMAGVPFHTFDGYVQKLVYKGFKIAIAETQGVSLLEPPTDPMQRKINQELREQTAAQKAVNDEPDIVMFEDESEDFYNQEAKKHIENGLKGVEEYKHGDYLAARLIAANAFSDVVNKDMSYFDAQYVDPVSDRLFYEKRLLENMLSKMPEATNRAIQEEYIKAISERRPRTKNFANVDHTQMCSDVFN
jgi:DNA mismatch repair ATPase MutS